MATPKAIIGVKLIMFLKLFVKIAAGFFSSMH